MNKKQQVLLAYFQENESQRQIAKRLNLSRNTVKKYIDQELVAKQQDTRNLPITNNYVSPPSYKKRKSSRSVNIGVKILNNNGLKFPTYPR